MEDTPMNKELASKSIGELSPLIREKQISSVEVTEAILDRVEKYNPQVNAYIKVNADQAMESAKQAESEIMKGHYRGALHGIPMALKDIFYVKGEVATMGSKIHKDFIADYDATVVSKLKEAGVIFTGTLNMHEYAFGVTNNNPHFGPCRNPWNLETIPGGSSGGSGAAVAANMTIASLGTDTGGSIRIPASLCGIVGLKPTHGRVSKYGVFPLSWSLDHAGPMTKTVTDAAIIMEAIAGYDKNDPTTIDVPKVLYTDYLSEDIKGLVIGIDEDYYFKNVDPEVEKLVRDGIETLKTMGAIVKTVSIPSIYHTYYSMMMTCFGEAGAIHLNNLKKRPQDFGGDVRLSLELGAIPSAVDYVHAQQLRLKIINDFAEAYKSVDVIVTPTLPFTAPLIGQNSVMLNGVESGVFDQLPRLTSPTNLTGLPSISVPCGFSKGMPVGMQIIGKAFQEEMILKVAYAYERSNTLSSLKPLLTEETVNNLTS
jgi:aspartyl-tRNA(Asn)/glutamyl-tRNA(Gln) amidotransferase subunit A